MLLQYFALAFVVVSCGQSHGQLIDSGAAVIKQDVKFGISDILLVDMSFPEHCPLYLNAKNCHLS
jgi:hypothetical protein